MFISFMPLFGEVLYSILSILTSLYTQLMTVSYKCIFLGFYPLYVCTTRVDRYSTSVPEPHQCRIFRTRQLANGEYLGTRHLLQE